MKHVPHRRAFIFILITLMLDAMGIGLIIPVMPDLIQDVQGGSIGQAAIWGGIISTGFAAMQFLFGPTIGGLSDRYGRRPILLFSLAVMSLDYLVLSFAQAMWVILFIQIINGIASATQSTASAFIADISKPEEKAQNFGLVGAAFGMGFIFGPLIGGILGDYGTRAPFIAAAGLAAANLVFGYFVLPETVTDSIRRPFKLARANPLGAFRALGKLPGLTRMLALILIYEFAFWVYPSTWAYFTRARFEWDSGMVGVSLAAFGISSALVQGWLMRYIIRAFSQTKTVLIGLSFNIGVFIFLAFVTNGWVALAFTPLTALGSVVTPTLQGILSTRVSDSQQGELQGLISSTRAVAAIFSPLVMTQIFWAFTSEGGLFLPGAPFLLSASLMCGAVAIFLTRKRKID